MQDINEELKKVYEWAKLINAGNSHSVISAKYSQSLEARKKEIDKRLEDQKKD